MKIVVVRFEPDIDWASQRQATEAAPGWHVADYSMDRLRVRLSFYDDAKAAAAIPLLTASPHVAGAHVEELQNRHSRRS
jgi:hypothetical protein